MRRKYDWEMDDIGGDNIHTLIQPDKNVRIIVYEYLVNSPDYVVRGGKVYIIKDPCTSVASAKREAIAVAKKMGWLK